MWNRKRENMMHSLFADCRQIHQIVWGFLSCLRRDLVRVARMRAVGEEERGGLERARDNSRNREHEKEERWLSALAKPKYNSLFNWRGFGIFIWKCSGSGLERIGLGFNWVWGSGSRSRKANMAQKKEKKKKLQYFEKLDALWLVLRTPL
jgi:hypothetical protein